MAKKKAPANRTAKGTFQKGKSGNPNGRPKRIEDISSKCRDMAPDVLDMLRNIVGRHTEKTSDRIKAGEIILAYGYGKPKQAIDFDSDEGSPLRPLVLEVVTNPEPDAP